MSNLASPIAVVLTILTISAGVSGADSISVKVRAGVSTDAAASVLRGDVWTDSIATVEPLFRVPAARIDLAAKHGLDRWLRVRLRPGTDPRAIERSLRALAPIVEVAEQSALGAFGDVTLPNDPNFATQFGVHNTGQTVSGSVGVVDADCDGPEAWALEPSRPVIVGVVDAGVAQHVDMAGRVLPGWNISTQTPEIFDACSSHGTHVSGIVAATRNNGTAIAGLNDVAFILPVQVFYPNCTGQMSEVAEGFVWAVDHGAQIINASIHSYEFEQVVEDSVNYCYDAGVLVVAIAGNGNADVAYPGKHEHALAVAATTNKDVRASFSNNGPEVEIAAAGANVMSLVGTSGVGFKSGTSMAAPHVTGLGAMLLGRAPWLTPDALWELMRDTADDVEAPGFDENTGWGRINAFTAMTTLLERLASGDLDADGTVGPQDLAMLLGAWGPATGSDGLGDIDGDGDVGPTDLGILLGAWGA
jgi:subtilisin family serine protease